MKLVAAKCPSCGANIDVDENSDSTKCEFCNTKILVDDAIAKYKVELSGKVKVSGIKDEDDKLDIIRKHFKVGNDEQAYRLLGQLLKENPYNFEALKLKTDHTLSLPNLSMNDYENCLKTLDVIEKIDDDKKYKKYVDTTREKINNLMLELEKEITKKQIELDQQTKVKNLCNEYLNKRILVPKSSLFKKLARAFKAKEESLRVAFFTKYHTISNVTLDKITIVNYNKQITTIECSNMSLDEKYNIVSELRKKQQRTNFIIISAIVVFVIIMMIITGAFEEA